MRPHHAPANRHQTRTLRDRYAIDAGGMGEVYKAADTRLNRTVAVKVLPPQFSESLEMKQRFERRHRPSRG
jgi:serine/threonine protein kinase